MQRFSCLNTFEMCVKDNTGSISISRTVDIVKVERQGGVGYLIGLEVTL